MDKLVSANRWQKVLFLYWLAVPILFYCYLALMTVKDQVSMGQLIQQVPGVTVGVLVTSMLLLQAMMLYSIGQQSKAKNGLLGRFLWFSLIQQLLVGNIPGAILSFMAERTLLETDEKLAKNVSRAYVSGMIVIGLLSLLILFLMMRMRGVN